MNLPSDIKAETLLNLLRPTDREITLRGKHKRNAYEDMRSFAIMADGRIMAEISKAGLYDILPEALFHPIDRFDNIPANEYKERFREEFEAEQKEEAEARAFFAPFDKFIFNAGCEINAIKDSRFADNSVLADIILDSTPTEFVSNRFIKRIRQFVPLCSKIRGDRTLITMILRKILRDEGITLEYMSNETTLSDRVPRYNMSLEDYVEESSDVYLGSTYDENILEYEIRYWDDDECTEKFLDFIAEMQVFEDFLNDYFIGLESRLKFNIFTRTNPIAISDDTGFNYLEFNTNL